jgi:hypothetical protein
MRTILTIILTIFFSSIAFGTDQMPDKIIYNEKEYRLLTYPLENYFKKYPDKRPKGEEVLVNGEKRWRMSTNLMRRYWATFEIKDNQLYLKDIEIMIWDKKQDDSSWKSVRNKLFPNQKLMKIDWMTGLLVLPVGEIVNYVHMGYGSTYERYILLEIDNGNITKEKQFDYQEYKNFREKQFQAFKKTDEYQKMKTELQKDSDSDEFIDSFLRDFVVKYTSKILVE